MTELHITKPDGKQTEHVATFHEEKLGIYLPVIKTALRTGQLVTLVPVKPEAQEGG